ncbi:MAG: hypothetical protein EA415_00525 [Sphaerobacteraceae bacterium]|nr:MAG: hypothetical protein EA415_00525 [Sphaerobacteraceae bacterium]
MSWTKIGNELTSINRRSFGGRTETVGIDVDKGPYLLMAVLCQRADQDQYGSFNVINVLEQLVVGSDDPGAPEEFPGFRLESQLVVSLASGEFRGDAVISIVPTDPALKKLEAVSQEVRFSGEDHRVTIVSNVSLDVEHTGVYWFNVLLDDKSICWIPLRIGYHRGHQEPWLNLTPN